MRRKRLLEIEELDEVSIVDTPAVGDALVRLTKRDEAPHLEPDTEWDEKKMALTLAALDYAAARQEAALARTVGDVKEVYRDIERAAAALRRENPDLDGATALSEALRRDPLLWQRYEAAFRREELERAAVEALERYQEMRALLGR